MFCPWCGAENAEGAPYCQSCRRPLLAAQQSPVQPSFQAYYPQAARVPLVPGAGTVQLMKISSWFILLVGVALAITVWILAGKIGAIVGGARAEMMRMMGGSYSYSGAEIGFSMLDSVIALLVFLGFSFFASGLFNCARGLLGARTAEKILGLRG